MNDEQPPTLQPNDEGAMAAKTGSKHEIERVTIRNSIRMLRFMQGEMTQHELAQRVGVSRQTVNAIEGGKYSPTLELAFRIARVFGKPMDEVWVCEVRG
jgi:putative transcriptional regulator